MNIAFGSFANGAFTDAAAHSAHEYGPGLQLRGVSEEEVLLPGAELSTSRRSSHCRSKGKQSRFWISPLAAVPLSRPITVRLRFATEARQGGGLSLSTRRLSGRGAHWPASMHMWEAEFFISPAAAQIKEEHRAGSALTEKRQLSEILSSCRGRLSNSEDESVADGENGYSIPPATGLPALWDMKRKQAVEWCN
ncbi:hypothetical protein EYF80_017914 [Liparis tanakae]|uniref:Uncharacterized protein n=1 Tax=Liparis tanakae TaxID=230148 RepID=A0A4Z2I1P6_9TELE|nr:hypothetical protein EYF80_017914 [Liparis tanakae]